MYAVQKTLVYYTYYLRLDVSYGESDFQVNRCLLYFLYLVTTIYFLIYIIFIATEDSSNYEWNDDYKICVDSVAHIDNLEGWLIAIGIVVYECVIGTISLILFIKPLCRLTQLQNDRSFHSLYIKITLCNGTIIISSVIGIIAYSMTGSNVLLFIDNVINPLCLILMVKVHEELYERTCKWCISKKCCQFKENDEVDMIDLASLSASSPKSSTKSISRCVKIEKTDLGEEVDKINVNSNDNGWALKVEDLQNVHQAGTSTCL